MEAALSDAELNDASQWLSCKEAQDLTGISAKTFWSVGRSGTVRTKRVEPLKHNDPAVYCYKPDVLDYAETHKHRASPSKRAPTLEECGTGWANGTDAATMFGVSRTWVERLARDKRIHRRGEPGNYRYSTEDLGKVLGKGRSNFVATDGGSKPKFTVDKSTKTSVSCTVTHMVTVAEAAARVGCSKSTITRAANDGRLKCTMTPIGRTFTLDDIDAFKNADPSEPSQVQKTPQAQEPTQKKYTLKQNMRRILLITECAEDAYHLFTQADALNRIKAITLEDAE